MSKVLYLVSSLKACAPTTQLRYIMEGLDRRQFEPHVLTLSPEPTDSALAGIAQMGVEVESLNLSRGEGVVLAGRRLREVLERVRPDLIHSSGFRADILAADSAAVPTITTIRNYPFHDYPMKFGRFLGMWMAWRHCRVLGGFSAVVPCSHAIAGLFGRSGSGFHVIQDGIDTDHFIQISDAKRRQTRQAWGVGEGERVFVTAGSLIARKDPVTLLRGFLTASAAIKGHLFILGDGPLRDSCRRLSADDKRIRMFGHLKDVRPYLQAADYYVSASHSEGLPNAVLEAMACGLPVALSDIPSHREQIESSPVVGELFPVGDATGLGRALESLAGSDRAMRSEAAVALVKENFTARGMSLAYQALYSRLLDKSRAA